MMYEREMLGGPAGNISARLDDETILLTPSGLFKQFLTPDQIIRITPQGEKIGPYTDANRDSEPTSEVPMHLAFYNNRPEIHGVVHAHPRHCIALSVAGLPIRPQVLTEGVLFLGNIATADFATPTTKELGDNVEKVIHDGDSVLLPYHGVIVGGTDLMAAYAKLEVLELCAQISTTVAAIGEEKPLPNEEIENILKLRADYGMDLPSDSKLLDK